MKTFIKQFAVTSAVALLLVGLSPPAKADAWNKKTVISINGPIQVPNKVLDAGQYVFKLADSMSNRHIVQIFNGDETHIITTILAIPNYRLQPRGKSVFSFWETPAGQPPALRAWFYPGDNFGQEFQYKPVELAQITRQSGATTTYTQTQEQTDQRVLEEERTDYVAAVPEPAPEPAPVAEPEPVPAEPAQQETISSETERVQSDRPAELPRTASNYPLIILAGVLSLGAFVVTGLGSKRRL